MYNILKIKINQVNYIKPTKYKVVECHVPGGNPWHDQHSKTIASTQENHLTWSHPFIPNQTCQQKA